MRVLCFARMEDKTVKGVDIIARAMGLLDRAHTGSGQRPWLVLRGCPEDERDALEDYVLGEAQNDNLQLRCLPWATPEGIVGDLRQCSLCVMPSRSEPFGLASLEAIAIGVPVLVSSLSGVAEFLLAVDEPLAKMMIVPTTPRARGLSQDASAWMKAIGGVLSDLPRSFERAKRLRQAIQAYAGLTTASCFVRTLTEVLRK